MLENCWTPDDRERVLEEVADGLWRYVARHARAVAPAERLLADLTGLTPAALDTLRHLHLLLSDEVAVFVDAALPALLRRLRAVAPPRPLAGRAAVRGRIAWGATSAARARSGGDRALYVTMAPCQSYSTAETRLLARTLDGLAAACAALRMHLAGEPARGWTETLAALAAAVTRARGDPRLAAVERDDAQAPADLAACRRSPHTAVRLLAAAYTRYRDLVERPISTALIDALRQRALVPLDDDTLYELWALLGAATVFDDAGWALDMAALAGQDAVPFTYRAPDGRAVARLRFGHTPSHWRRGSRYRAVFQHYGLSGAVRRPDLIVEVRRGAVRRYLLVEVKRTRDPGYIADSIYKVLGYLADFQAAFSEQQGTQALLLLWDGATSSTLLPAPAPLVLATHRDYRATLSGVIAAISHAGPHGS